MKIHIQVKQLREENKILIEGLNDIRRYLNLEKFSIDTSVNKQDILNRIEDIISNKNDIDNEYLINHCIRI